MITVRFIQQQNDWELAVAEGVRQFIRQNYGVTVIVDVEETVEAPVKKLDPTPYISEGYRSRDKYLQLASGKWKRLFDPRPMFEQDESKYPEGATV